MRVPDARSSLLVLLSATLLFSATPIRSLGEWHRVSEEPLISPQGDGWESVAPLTRRWFVTRASRVDA